MSAAIVKFKPKGGGFDPVYSAIEAHRIAVATLNEIAGYAGEAEACNQLSAALLALLACQPATMAGLLALLDYVGQPEWLDEDEDRATILVPRQK
jgi:hypothetical protein